MRKPLKLLFDEVWKYWKDCDRYKERKIIYLEVDRITDISKLWYQEEWARPFLLAQWYINVKDKLTDFLKDFMEDEEQNP